MWLETTSSEKICEFEFEWTDPLSCFVFGKNNDEQNNFNVLM